MCVYLYIHKYTLHTHIYYVNKSFDSTNIYIYKSAVKRLIAFKIKVFFTKYIMCTVFIYYVYINTHTYSIYLENIHMYAHFQVHLTKLEYGEIVIFFL